MANLISFEALGYRKQSGRFAKQSAALQTEQREAVREAGRVGVQYLREEAPRRSGIFQQGIAYRTDLRGNRTSATLYVGGEHAFLLPFIVEGTREHSIYPRGNYPLRFFWPKGPEGPKIYYFMHVTHPGTDPNPFVARAWSRMQGDVERIVNRAAVRVNWL
jgi:hypothetical protein